MAGTANLSIVVAGASGDLARRKIFPALFSLYCQGFLPAGFNVFGFARTPFTTEGFRSRIAENLTCRYTPDHACAERMREFLSSCRYFSGDYGSKDAFLDLYSEMRRTESGGRADRIFYLAIPSSVFTDTVRSLGDSGLVNCGAGEPWTRIVIEKPFGRDRASSDSLVGELARVVSEEQTYRIDHYLGKAVIQNLMVLRFANAIFEPLWNRSFVESVVIDWRESIGVGMRGGYFDTYGIIRDVVQNHLTQVLALVAMEKPADSGAKSVRDQKVRLLRSVLPVSVSDAVVGQYGSGRVNGVAHRAYTAEEGVPPESFTPTYAALTLRVDNERWRGVPFVIRAGKGLDAHRSEVRIRFRALSENIFCRGGDCPAANEFVIRIQPDEALYLRVMNREPGLELKLVESDLNLRYQAAFAATIPDAYECLLLDVIRGDRSLFIREDELAAAWDIFTPLLHSLEANKVRPVVYPFGSHGPDPRKDG